MTIHVAKDLKLVDLDSLKPYERNARTHSPEQIEQIAASIKEFGFTAPILIDGEKGIIAGHGRLEAAKRLGLKKVPVVELAHLTEAQKRAYILADNKIAANAGWDAEVLAAELAEIEQEFGDEISLVGFSEEELDALLEGDLDIVETEPQSLIKKPAAEEPEEDEDPGDEEQRPTLAERFGVPPFSVLDARQGYWQERKRTWLSMGIQSEIGRKVEGKALHTVNARADDPDLPESMRKIMAAGSQLASVFDPVLCELAYRWFSPSGGLVLDPFAGGSVRGVVASKTGRRYVGVDLREEQVLANRKQAEEICEDPVPLWKTGDSREIKKIAKGVEADLVFSCPPYGDLEIYSDDPRDLSTLEYDKFREAYFEIIAASCELLRPDRFACFVVGDFRDKKGLYQNFVSDTIAAFERAGLRLYNEAILVTAIASVSLRAGKQFSASRKLGKTHQNVLVFVKGDPKRATQACGEVEVEVPEEDSGGDGVGVTE